MKNIHLITPFSRHSLKDALVLAYNRMDVIWHPIMFEDEARESVFWESWIEPVIIPGNAPAPGFMAMTAKLNHFIKNYPIDDEDYYVVVADDSMYEEGVFDEIRRMDADVVVVSLKRGHHIPADAPVGKAHETTTLIAAPENMRVGHIDGQQYFCKGRVLRKYLCENSFEWDGLMAEKLARNHEVAYRPDLFGLFNYYEPGRWDQHGKEGLK